MNPDLTLKPIVFSPRSLGMCAAVEAAMHKPLPEVIMLGVPPPTPSPYQEMLDACQRSMVQAAGWPPGFLEAQEPMIGMKFRDSAGPAMPKYTIRVDWADGLPMGPPASWLSHRLEHERRKAEKMMLDMVRGASMSHSHAVGQSDVLTLPTLIEAYDLLNPPEAELGLVVLDPRLVQWFRRPRSKKKRIRKKWRLRPENWRPSRLVYQQTYLMGAAFTTSPESLQRPRNLLMHPQTWAMLQREHPEVCRKLRVVRAAKSKWAATQHGPTGGDRGARNGPGTWVSG